MISNFRVNLEIVEKALPQLSHARQSAIANALCELDERLAKNAEAAQ